MTRPRRKAFTLVQLVLAVVVMGVFIRIVFHTSDATNSRYNHSATAHRYQGPQLSKLDKALVSPLALPEVAEEEADAAEPDEAAALVVPFKPLDRDRGSMLARLLRQHRPTTTDEQIDGLVDTLPPNASPSVIVIIPTAEKPTTPPLEKSCPDSATSDDAVAADTEAVDGNTPVAGEGCLPETG